MRSFGTCVELTRGIEDGLRIGKCIAQLIGAERLQQIVLDAACDEIAEQTDVVDLSCSDNDCARFADFCKRIDVVEGIAAFTASIRCSAKDMRFSKLPPHLSVRRLESGERN